MNIVGFIVVGDRTSHGGVVLTGDQTWKVDGAEVARIGDLVSCPRCKRTALIATSKDPSFTSKGVPVAFDGDMTDCGAILYSRHNAHAGLSDGEGEPFSLADVKEHRPPPMQEYQRHFILRDSTSAQPLPNTAYTITTEEGRVIKGYTDPEGRTDVVWTTAPSRVELVAHRASPERDDPYHYGENMDYTGL
ncbi:PAAR domain-containing protein [uncultured Herbaspirillum sp.]|uniref:PAAR domain-containing protein n=1 Tax=uncultured Herbaspirillum sp. TaxID=160236 RepID=UPI0025833E89|nr:PAAR domain-containing protein [uncultured Herbaspirillum sp.]